MSDQLTIKPSLVKKLELVALEMLKQTCPEMSALLMPESRPLSDLLDTQGLTSLAEELPGADSKLSAERLALILTDDGQANILRHWSNPYHAWLLIFHAVRRPQARLPLDMRQVELACKLIEELYVQRGPAQKRILPLVKMGKFDKLTAEEHVNAIRDGIIVISIHDGTESEFINRIFVE